MFTRVLMISVFVFAFHGLARSQTWESPDKWLSVTPPDANQFRMVASPPSPYIALWVSNDETMKFGVTATKLPPDTWSSQSAAEEELAKEIGGEVIRLPAKQNSGHYVWKMTGKGTSGEITQSVVRNANVMYKVTAATVGGPPDSEAVNRFIDSLATAQPGLEPKGLDLHDVSKTFIRVGLLLGVGLLVYYLTYGKKNRQ